MKYVASNQMFFPTDDDSWETIEPSDAGWDPDSLEDALEFARLNNSTGLLISHKGRIMAEKYWEPDEAITSALPEQSVDLHRQMYHGKNLRGGTIEDVASLQKSVVVVLAGIARQKGLLDYDDKVIKHLGLGWTNTSPNKEERITIRHLMTMISGLNTELEYEVPPGEVWRYNTGAYQWILHTIAAAAGRDYKDLTAEWLIKPLCMADTAWEERTWVESGIDAAGLGLRTTARDLVRFGIMVLAGGKWNQKANIIEQAALDEMLQPSQKLHVSYGQLWWLNGQKQFMNLLSGKLVDGPFIKTAPSDLVAASGVLNRCLHIVPSLELVVARLGGMGPTVLQKPPVSFNNAFWKEIMKAAP